jgi:hypothetical protein
LPDSSTCPTVPTEATRNGFHISSLSNLAPVLSDVGTPVALAEAAAILPDVRRSYSSRDHLPKAKIYWLEGKITASGHPWPVLTDDQRKDRKRKAVRQLERGVVGLLAHGSPEDAVMCLLELCALPWIRRPEQEIRVRMESRDCVQRAQLETHLEALDPALAARVNRVRQVAADVAAEIDANRRVHSSESARRAKARVVRERVRIELARAMRWFASAGALPPIFARPERSVPIVLGRSSLWAPERRWSWGLSL